MYHIVTSGYHNSGFGALIIVSRLYHIAILNHVLPSVHYNHVNMNLCIFMETMIEYWILNTGFG